MADCELCGAARPTLCPVKVQDPRVKSAYPTGTWRGINEECLDACLQANMNRVPSDAKKCNLCGIKNVALYQVKVQVPIFQEPYHREVNKPCARAVLKLARIRRRGGKLRRKKCIITDFIK